MRIPEHFETELAAEKQKGYLQKVRPESLPAELMKIGDLSTINLFVISCSDGHQFMDITTHTFNCVERVKRHYGLQDISNDCIHWRTENGGPYVLSEPKLQSGELHMARTRKGKRISVLDSTLYWIEGAMKLKKLHVGLLEPHCVCGMTQNIFTSFVQYEERLAEAKEFLMQEFGLRREQLICWLQAHCKEGRMTHHVDYSKVQCRLKAA